MSTPVTPGRDVSGNTLADLMSLAGRTAVVTGGGRGIGRAIAERLAEAGASVVIGDLDASTAEQAAAELHEKWGVPTFGGILDVRDPVSVDALADRADAIGGGLSVWVNNAGIYPSTPLVEVTDKEWRDVMDVTLTGTFNGSRAAAQRMVARRGMPGRVIINLSSMAGLRGRRNLASYVAAKHGVTGLTRSMAIELGGDGIRVLGIAPSVVDTPGMRQRRESAGPEEAAALKKLEDGLVESIPLARAGVPDDVARMVLYCASDLSEWVSGLVIPIDGGLSAA